MELYMFSTLCVLADKFLTDTLNDLRDDKITVDEAISNLIKVEDMDDNMVSYYPEADMTKETVYDFVEHISKIKGISVDDVWLVYDTHYNIFIEKMDSYNV